MKRGLVIAGVAAWTIGVVTLAVAWWLCRTAMEIRKESPRYGPPVRASVADWVPLDGKSWMQSGWRTSRSNEVHVKRKLIASGQLRVVVDDRDGYSWDTVTITLQRAADHTIQADAIVKWHKDFGPPFDGTLADLGGSVEVSSADLSGATSLMLRFDLHGTGPGNTPWQDHGVVAIPQ